MKTTTTLTALATALLLSAAAPAQDSPAAGTAVPTPSEQTASRNTVLSIPDDAYINDARPNPNARYYIYFVTADWCPHSNVCMMQYVPLYAQLREEGVVDIIGLSYDHTREEARLHLKKHYATFACVTHDAVPDLFSSACYLPQAVFVNASGKQIKRGDVSLILDYRKIINSYEQEHGLPLSFPDTDFSSTELRDAGGFTPLMRAAHSGDAHQTQLLLQKGADIHARNDEGKTPLIIACESFKTILPIPPSMPTCEGVQSSVQMDLYFHAQWLYHERMQTLLYQEAVLRRKITETLLDGGADVDAKDNAGKTALMYACTHRCAEGGGHHMQSFSTGHAEVLLAHNPEINAKDNKNNTALMYAIDMRHYSLAEQLLNRGADPGIINSEGKTALHLAAIKGLDTIISLLLEKGADAHARDEQGKTPLDYAQEYNYLNAAEILRRHFEK